jgi:hypothetical protein
MFEDLSTWGSDTAPETQAQSEEMGFSRICMGRDYTPGYTQFLGMVSEMLGNGERTPELVCRFPFSIPRFY